MKLIDTAKATAVIADYFDEICDTEITFNESEILRRLNKKASEQPTIDAVPKWILCGERLPEDDRTKVVTLANGNVEGGYYSNGDWWCIGDKDTLENPTVIAWMPLPKPYEVKE